MRIHKKILNYLRNLRYRKQQVFIRPSCVIDYAHSKFEGMNAIYGNTVFSGTMGLGSYISHDSSINASIGRFCSIGPYVKCIGGIHPSRNYVSTHPAFFSTAKQAGFTFAKTDRFNENIYADDDGHLVSIGNDVWIGANAIILPGVHIGDGAIVAAGSVVVKNVKPYEIVGGNPAKLIRQRFTDEEIEKLNSLKWWDKDTDWISSNYEMFKNVGEFLEKI